MSEINILTQLGATGDRGKRAAHRVAKISNELVTVLQRVAPFLARRKLAVTIEMPRCLAGAELEAELAKAAHKTVFAVEPCGAAGTLALDGTALAVLLDGVLGGQDSGQEPPNDVRMTRAQLAIADRLAAGVIRGFSDVFAAKIGGTFAVPTGGSDGPNAPTPSVLLAFRVGERARITLAIPMQALAEDAAAQAGEDASLAAAMLDVSVDVVVELGTVSIALATLANLSVGDTLTLGLPVDEEARVCVGGAPLFRGRPTVAGHAVGISLEREEWHAA